MPISHDVGRYLHHLEFNRRVTSNTLKSYRSTLSRFSSWLGDRSLDEDSVAQFLSQFGHAPSANVMGAQIRGLVKFMNTDVRITRAKEEVREVEALSSAEVQALCEAAAELGEGVDLVITLLAETGLRFAEMCSLNIDALQVRNEGREVAWLNVVGKGRKHRKVPLSDKALQAFMQMPLEWTASREAKLRAMMAEAGKRAGSPFHVHPHLLRASFVSIMLNERKVDAIKVAKIVGHASVNTMLSNYYRASIDDLHSLVA